MKKTIKILTLITIFFVFPSNLFSQKQQNSVNVVSQKKVAKTKDFKTVNAIPEDMLAEKVKQATLITNNVSLADGIVYSIVSSTKTTFNDCFKCGPAAGYDSSCQAKYNIETRNYSEYRDGQVVRVWMSTVSVFMGCGSW